VSAEQGESAVPKPKPPSKEPWCTIRIVKTLWPPQRGTQRLHRHYGVQLVCVRYRQDKQLRWRYTTVELLIDHGPLRRHARQR
jgi:hypothetical protein